VSRREVRLDEELTFREAARALRRQRDPRGRRLRGMVLARERERRQRIAIRIGGRERQHLRITLGALYRAFPELRPARVDDLAELARAFQERSETRTRFLVREEIASDVGPRVSKLEKRTALTEKYIKDLHQLDGPRMPPKAKTGP